MKTSQGEDVGLLCRIKYYNTKYTLHVSHLDFGKWFL